MRQNPIANPCPTQTYQIVKLTLHCQAYHRTANQVYSTLVLEQMPFTIE